MAKNLKHQIVFGDQIIRLNDQIRRLNGGIRCLNDWIRRLNDQIRRDTKTSYIFYGQNKVSKYPFSKLISNLLSFAIFRNRFIVKIPVSKSPFSNDKILSFEIVVLPLYFVSISIGNNKKNKEQKISAFSIFTFTSILKLWGLL